MTKPAQFTLKAALLLLSGLYFSGCSGGVQSSSFGSSSSEAGAGYVPPGASNGASEVTNFYIAVDSNVNDVAHVHQEGSFGTKCSISPSSSLQDIRCIVDIPENELFNHGLALKYNVPPGMCRYLSRTPYWYYNYEVGYGPTSILITRVYNDGALASATCSFNGGVAGPCTANNEVTIDVSSSTPVLTCTYDHTLTGGKNGCLGTYTLTLDTTLNVTGPPPTTSNTVVTTKNTWGTSIASIVGGAARTGWPLSSNGFPFTQVVPAHLGLFADNNIYTLPAPISSISNATNLEIANYSTPATNSHNGFVSAATSQFPYALDPIDDLDGTLLPAGNDSYLFECHDQAAELIHRVKVYVREWDTYQDWVNYVVLGNHPEVPDRRADIEGTGCTGIEGPCNDYYDFDDFAVLRSNYPTASPANDAARENYFPQLEKK